MLMEHHALRTNWPASAVDADYSAQPTLEQQHFPTPFHGYAAFPPVRYKDEESPRTTFGSLYSALHPSQHVDDHHPLHPHYHGNSGGSYSGGSHFSIPSPTSLLPPHHSLSLSLPRPGIVSTVASSSSGTRKASEEERKAKHREAQRRFVRRKKAEMVQLKQYAVELELQYQLLEITRECIALDQENLALENDIELARHEADRSSNEHKDVKKSDVAWRSLKLRKLQKMTTTNARRVEPNEREAD
ncbi:hypothetical protein PybrP1_003491, partial [[Pythium] brassicae (nom. inval.)]